jgi:hypothetical protein
MRAEVTVRCGVCRRGLETITEESTQRFPPDGDPAWRDPERGAVVESCPRHGGVPRTLTELDEQRAARGLPAAEPGRLMHYISWADLLPAFEESRRRGRSVSYVVMPRGRSL